MSPPKTVPEQLSGRSLVFPILLILFGLFAIGLPFETSLGVVRVIGWLLILSGVTKIVCAFRTWGVGNIFWKFFVAILHGATGMYLLTHTMMAVAGLTALIGTFLLIQGAMDVVLYLTVRNARGSNWILFEGMVALVLSVIVRRYRPSSSLWLIGSILGTTLVVTGITRLITTLAAQRLTAALAI